ncbi:Uu.00g073980.m01.CDS01 [Anthostomella pinea]|uniref:Uu.00g073980.m01.CDS01 n=1 Tax=Anthostomella pinea TaxID=933095 RepID=A0AAI8VWK8_9PEZI|nr:Uu.00g073980.m01.CDS01 [Anthostomella pinea]
MNHQPTDAELDHDWKPSGRRPQSTIARSFSQELMDIFRIENSVADLTEQVDKRKQQVTSGQSELEALEQRIKEMEARLNQSKPGAAASGLSPRTQRTAVGDTFGQAPQPPQAPAAGRASRPGTAKQSHQQAPVRGGAMPPTPTASEGEYELVNTSSSSGDGGAETRSFTDYVIVPQDGHDRDS